MVLKEKMCKRIISIDIKKSAFEAALKMKEYDIGFLPVVEKNKVIGVLTDRDLVVRGIANHMDSNLQNIMSKNLITIDLNKTIEDALRLMKEQKVKRLLITDANKIVGVLSLSDIMNAGTKENLIETFSSIFQITRNQDIEEAEVDSFYL